MMMLICIVACVFLLFCGCCVSIPTCQSNRSQDYSKRTLSIVSFETRGRSYFQKQFRGYAQRFGPGLKDVVVLGKNCSWRPLKYFNKPLYYSKWLNATLETLTQEGKNPNDAYAILLDTDVILNARPLKYLWENFDCARKGKPILMGGESSCWYGLQCKPRHIMRYYEPLGPTLSPFINSGYIMGSIPALQRMFSFIGNNYDYFRRIVYWIPWFCDQSAYTFYYGHNRDMIQIDDYQHVFGTLSLFVEGGVARERSVCRSSRNYEVVRNCSEILFPLDLFSLDPHTCMLTTNPQKPKSRLIYFNDHFAQMSHSPFVYHGNARGKAVAKILIPLINKCLQKKYHGGFTGDFIIDPVGE